MLNIFKLCMFVIVMHHQFGIFRSFGKMAYPAEEKWEELYKQCYSAIGCSRDRVNEDCSEVWNKVASFMTHFYERKWVENVL